jgi:predicted acyl esterase
MESNGWRVPAGHRLRVHVQSSAKNIVFPNTNTGDSPFEDSGKVVAENRIYHGGRYPSHVRLPVVPAPGGVGG